MPGTHHTDVVIIVDASTSMAELTRSGRPKIEAAREAALLFLGERDMASSPDGFYLAPDGEDLLAIYRRIANVIPCPPEEYWPGRLWP